jgi:hypothetical protein
MQRIFRWRLAVVAGVIRRGQHLIDFTNPYLILLAVLPMLIKRRCVLNWLMIIVVSFGRAPRCGETIKQLLDHGVP